MPQVSVLLTSALMLAASPALAGTITGVVQARGPAIPPPPAGSSGGYDSRTLANAEKVDYEHLTDFVIYINQPVAGPVSPPTTTTVLTQKGASFDPHVLPIVVGTTVTWPNMDTIVHNVYSTADAAPFDLGYYKQERGKTPPDWKFDKVGRVDVFCAIHTRMHCIVLVLPNVYFVKADANGKYRIPNVPPGTYKLRAWHERLPAQEREIVVPAEGDVKVDFTLSVSSLPGK